jgi:hypothetical protein
MAGVLHADGAAACSSAATHIMIESQLYNMLQPTRKSDRGYFMGRSGA